MSIIVSGERLAELKVSEVTEEYKIKVKPGLWYVQRSPYEYNFHSSSDSCLILHHSQADLSRLPITLQTKDPFVDATISTKSISICQEGKYKILIDLVDIHLISSVFYGGEDIIVIPISRDDESSEERGRIASIVIDARVHEIEERITAWLSSLGLSEAKYDSDEGRISNLSPSNLRMLLIPEAYKWLFRHGETDEKYKIALDHLTLMRNNDNRPSLEGSKLYLALFNPGIGEMIQLAQDGYYGGRDYDKEKYEPMYKKLMYEYDREHGFAI